MALGLTALALAACSQGTAAGGRLALAGAGQAPAGVAAAAEGARTGGSGRYHVVGPLPDGPGEAAVWQLPVLPDAELLGRVQSLARALGLTSAARSDGRTVTVADGPRVLRVAAAQGAPWTYVDQLSPACLPVPEEPYAWGEQASVVSCAAAPPQSSVASTTLPAVARALAGPVLAAGSSTPLGPPQVVQGQPAEVRATPRVGGAGAYGLETAAAVTGDRVVWAYGWLGLSAASPDKTYPLRSASDLVAALEQEPVPMPACPALSTQSSACVAPVEITITGARLALLLDRGTAGRLLVPAWELQVRGGPPVVRVAVAPTSLVPLGAGTTGGSGGGAATGTSSGSVSGSVGGSKGGVGTG